MYTLIAKSYSEAEAQRYRTYQLTQVDRDTILGACQCVLTQFPPMPHACVAMSTLLASMIREKSQIPIHVVAGNLRLGNKRLFFYDATPETWASHFSTSNLDWDGHCWVVVGGQIGDISLFRSAYDAKAPKWFNQLIVQTFGKGRGALFNTADGMREDNLYYDSQYVLTTSQIELCANGAIQIIRSTPAS